MERTAHDGGSAAQAPPVVPEVTCRLRRHFVRRPRVICEAPGICVLSRRVRAVLFSPDVAVIRNTDADAVIAVYPLTPQPVFTHALVEADFQRAHGVDVNAPTPNTLVAGLRRHLEVPAIATGGPSDETLRAVLDSGAHAVTPPTTAGQFRGIMERYRTDR